MKHATWIVWLALLAAGPEATAAVNHKLLAALRERIGPDAARCTSVTVSPPLEFHGRRLNEIPDIREPELRLANELMSNGCFSRALDKLDAILKKDPNNGNARYIVARMTWMKMGYNAAEPLLISALLDTKDFPSGVVLLAGIRFSQKRYDETAELLDKVESKSPTDLWIFMNRLRLEAVTSPSPDLRPRLLEIVRSKAFPPNAREIAGTLAAELPNQTEGQFEEVMRARLEIESSVSMACKASELAHWLGDVQARFKDVIELLESPRATQGNCLGLEENRAMLAQAYLMEATNISRHLVPGNQRLFDRAKAVVDGDFSIVIEHARNGPDLAALTEFLESVAVN